MLSTSKFPGLRSPLVLALLFSMAPVGLSAEPADAPADLILTGGRVWTATGATEGLEKRAVAIRGDRILAVGSTEEVDSYCGEQTRVMDLDGRFVSPGFIDNHTHFNRAGALLLGVNLLDVADEAGLVARVREAQDRLPPGTWIVGGDWGAYEAWQKGSSGRDGEGSGKAFEPHRKMIDHFTRGRNPVLLSKWDRSVYLANVDALAGSGASCDWQGVECQDGEPSGRLAPEAAERVRAVIPAKSMEQRLAEARVALERLRSFGVTGIHDITPSEQLEVYQELKRRGELTVRVYARPTLDRWEHLAALGMRHGFGDDWIRIGGLKGFVDGIMGNSSARFYEPYQTSGERGRWRTMMQPEGNMEKLLLGADAAGHWPQVHAIGDEAIDTLLDLFARVVEVNGPKDRRLRVIHTQVLRGPEVAERMAEMGVIAEVQPYHAIDDMRWMEERIGERSRWAYAFKTLQDAGVLLSFGSDWPGTNASWYPANPMLGVYAAVTRQTLGGEPATGWFPQERVSVDAALRAFTVNNAWAAGEEDQKGTIEPGKLADLVVLESDPFAVDASKLKDVGVAWTILGGRIVYSAPAVAGIERQAD